MNKFIPHLMFILAILLAMLASSNLDAAQKKPLGIENIESWKRITEKVISPDGHWIAYKTEPARGDSRLLLHDNQGNKVFEHACAHNIRITDDSRFMVFTMVPKHEHVRELKQKKTPRGQVPRDGLGIYGLSSKRLETVKDIKNYKIPQHWAPWLAYQAETPRYNTTTKSKISNDTNQDKRETGDNGFALHLRNLETGKTRTWPFVTEYDFVEKAQKLFFVSTGDNQDFEAGLYLYDLEKDQLVTVLAGRNDYRQIRASSNGDKLAFLLKPGVANQSEGISLYLWDGQGTARKIVGPRAQGMPDGWTISEHGRIIISDSGERIYFGTAPPRPRRDPAILDDEYPKVDVWHGAEGLLHTVQLVNRDRELRRTYLAVVNLKDGSFMQIATEDVPESRLLDHGDADRVLLYSSKPYELQSMWDPMRWDVYLLDLKTGTRRVVAKNVRSRPKPSPESKYLLWFNYDNYSYYTHHVESGKTHRITSPSVIRADTETNTTFDYNAPYGSAGWLKDDRAVLIHDRYDIWKVHPKNLHEPVNLTLNGRKNKTVYRLIHFGHGNSVDENQPQYLQGTNELTRASGYYRARFDQPSKPKRLIGGSYRLSTPIKADDSDTVVYTKETFNTFPDLWVSDLTFRDNTRISDANPQQADFLWGTAELTNWTSLDGHKLEGLLYKPENFDPSRKHPMIVQFFHKSSDQLHNHRTPEYHRSRIDYHYFVSNGYIVFNPDIHFNDGYIGESAYKSIMPGVTSLVDRGFVDRRRIGIQGHSYSGYQIAYLATRTDMFAAIESGAPVVNFFSAYGGIRWQTGRNRAAQYEHDQTLATIWEAPLRFLENSPLFALDKVTSPILILHNDRDGSVPWTQGIEFFIALRRMHKPVWLLNYNGEGHCLRQLKNKKDFQIRMAQFFGHYLQDAPMPQWMSRGVPAVEKDHNLGYQPESNPPPSPPNPNPERKRVGN